MVEAAPAAVEAVELYKRYDQLVAVDGIGFRIGHGECFGFLGPNGAGKTTVMKMIYGRTPITGGRLTVLGLDARAQMRAIKARIGVVPQEDNLDPDFTPVANLLVYARYFGLSGPLTRRRAEELLAFVGLTEKRQAQIDDLSGGMKRRLVIARALVHKPELVILDEPTTGLDPQARHLVWNKLRELKDQGVTLLLTTHYMEEAARLCDRLVIMDRGRVLAAGPPPELITAHAGPWVLELRLDPAHHAAVLAAGGGLAAGHEAVGDTLLVYISGPEAAERLVGSLQAAAVPVQGYTARPTTLEDVFLRLAGRSLSEG